MSRFFFGRSPSSGPSADPTEEGDEVAGALRSLIQIQSITASAIFAKLVSKGVLTADEAADYMSEIAQALEIDVRSSLGADAASMLRSYGRALSAAGK